MIRTVMFTRREGGRLEKFIVDGAMDAEGNAQVIQVCDASDRVLWADELTPEMWRDAVDAVYRAWSLRRT